MLKKKFSLPDGTIVVLNTCTTQHDYVKMFDVQCHSCMVLNDADPAMRIWPHMLKTHNVHPASWYHYTPHSRGAFITVDGVPVARCMQYRTDLTQQRWSLFGDIKFVDKNWAIILHSVMRANGGHYIEEQQRTLMPFDVPGFDSGIEEEGIVCPLPHCDGQTKDFSVTFDAKGNRFIFWPYHLAPKNAYRITSTYNHDGYLRASEVLACAKRKDRHMTVDSLHNYNFDWSKI